MKDLSNKFDSNRFKNKAFFIDTHLHPFLIHDFLKKRDKKVKNLNDLIFDWNREGISEMIFISTSLKCASRYSDLCKNFSFTYYTIGIHPCEIEDTWREEIANFEKILENKDSFLIGVGEVGLDLYHETVPLKIQKEVFLYFIDLAIRYKLPLIIHMRNATDLLYQMLYEFKGLVHGIVHCYHESVDYGRKFLDLGFFLGIGGIITYPKNHELRDVVKKLGINALVFETDAPFLPVQSQRGSINTPLALFEIGNFIAEIISLPPEEVYQIVYHQSRKILGLN